MAKTSAARLAETISYLRAVDAQLAHQIQQILHDGGDVLRNQVSDQISLSGHTPWVSGHHDNNADTQRDALRALLLCQRVYFSNLWSPRFGPRTQPGAGPD